MTTRTGGWPRWARALSRRWTPCPSATNTGSARLMKRPLSTTPTTRRMRSSSRAGSAMGPAKRQSRMRLPPSVTNSSPAGDRRGRTSAANTSRAARVTSSPKATTSTGTGACVPSRSTSLAPSTTMARRRLALATIFSRSKAPPSPLIRFRVPRSTSSAPSIVRSICRCSAKEDQRNAGRPRLRRGSLRRWNADEAQALPMPAGQRLDRESRRRAGAEADDHALLDQLDRRLRRRALQRVAIGVGWEARRAHGLAAPAVALARIAAMAAL